MFGRSRRSNQGGMGYVGMIIAMVIAGIIVYGVIFYGPDIAGGIGNVFSGAGGDSYKTVGEVLDYRDELYEQEITVRGMPVVLGDAICDSEETYWVYLHLQPVGELPNWPPRSMAYFYFYGTLVNETSGGWRGYPVLYVTSFEPA